MATKMRESWKFVSFLIFYNSLCGQIPETENLSSEQFGVRKAAQEKIIAWALKGEGEKRLEELLQYYFEEDEPETLERLRAVMFQIKLALPETEGQGFLGIRLVDSFLFRNRGLPNGVYVSSLVGGTPAEKAGLKQGDVILKIDELSLDSQTPSLDLTEYVMGKTPGTKVVLKVSREEEIHNFEVRLMRKYGEAMTRIWRDGEIELDYDYIERTRKQEFYDWLRQKENEQELKAEEVWDR